MQCSMVAGEASSDLLGSLLLRAMKARWPQLHACGIGGSHMVAEGFDAWWSSQELAVRGYVEVLRHYPRISGIRRQLTQRLLDQPPRMFIGVDAPDFNLGLEAQLKAKGIPTVHFVCPSVWAWRGGRIKTLAESTDLVLCLFPFEAPLLQRAGVRAQYVGHPLADVIAMHPDRQAARVALGLASNHTVVCLMPGSRRSEISHIAPTMLRAAAVLAKQHPGLRFVLPCVPGMREVLARWLESNPVPGLQLLDGQSHTALAACDLTLIASGTATLEAALFKRPMVIVYRMNALTWQLMKRMAYQPWVGLPNILCREFVVPELIQEQFTVSALVQEANAWLADPQRSQVLQERFEALHVSLRHNTAQSATDAIQTQISA